MAGPALLLTAEHTDPQVAAREARRRLGSVGSDVAEERLVDAVVAEGFSEQRASEAVGSLANSTETTPTDTCAGGAESYASDD
jgi:hypothetical protein